MSQQKNKAQYYNLKELIERNFSKIKSQLTQTEKNNNNVAIILQSNGEYVLKENYNIKNIGHIGNCIGEGNYCQIYEFVPGVMVEDRAKVNVDFVLNEIKKLWQRSKETNKAFLSFTLREFNELFQDEDTISEIFIVWKRYTHILKVPRIRYEIYELVKENYLIHKLNLQKLQVSTKEILSAELGLYGLQQIRLSDNLRTYLDYNCAGFPLYFAQSLIRKILEQVQTLHLNDYYHGDLKPANMCIDYDEKLIFLGQTNCSALVETVVNYNPTKETTPSYILPQFSEITVIDYNLTDSLHSNKKFPLFGTRRYMPPEILFCYVSISKAIDIFSLGLIFYEMVFGRRFLSDQLDYKNFAIMEKNIGPIPQRYQTAFRSHYGDKAKALKYLDRNLSKKDRANYEFNFANEVFILADEKDDGSEEPLLVMNPLLEGLNTFKVKDKWEQTNAVDGMVPFVAMVKSMLQMEPDERPTITQLLNHEFMSYKLSQQDYKNYTFNSIKIENNVKPNKFNLSKKKV